MKYLKKNEIKKEGVIAEFTIPIAPVTKKNHGQIAVSRTTGKRFFVPSKQYRQYEKDASLFVPHLNINRAVNIRAVFYMSTRRRCDLTNLNQALHDILVTCGCITDDNFRIIASTDGSRVRYDRENPRTEVTIEEAEDLFEKAPETEAEKSEKSQQHL